MILAKPFSPIRPSPMLSWRSTPEPQGRLESLACTALKPVEADVPVELIDHAGDALGVGEIVPGGEGVLGVQADAQAGAVHSAHDLPQFAELGADVLAHAGHVFQAKQRALGCLIQHPVNTVHDLLEDAFVSGAAVAAGMEDDAAGPDLIGQCMYWTSEVTDLSTFSGLELPRLIR